MPGITFETSGFLPWLDLGLVRIPTYFVFISAVLSCLTYVVALRSKNRNFPLKHALDLYIAAMLGGFLGARLFHVFWEEPDYYRERPLLVFDFLQGGFVWFGGFAGGLIAVIVLSGLRNRKVHAPPLLVSLDFFAPTAALGYGLGRIACVLTGCCYGAVCHFHGAVFRLPTQGFSVVFELAVFALLLKLEKQDWSSGQQSGRLFFLWLFMHGIGRLVMELFRDDPRGPELGGLSIATLVSLVLILVGSSSLRSPWWSGFTTRIQKRN